jgi:hypothetical protein
VYADWFLPSRDELKAMYDNLKMSGKGSFDTGPLTAYYWSSSEDSSSKAWYILFADGVASTNDKDLVSRVRAARRF